MASHRPLAVPAVDAAPRIGMALADFLQVRPERFELIDGEIVEKMANVAGHDEIRDILLYAIRDANGGFITSERTFSLPDAQDRNWVKGSRIPDLLFFRQDRLDAYKADNPDWRQRPFALLPDLVIEIKSPTDRNRDVLDKVQRYLNDGVPHVWVIDMERQRVYQFQADGDLSTILTDKATLDGGDLISGFSIPVMALLV
ncbi:MAG: Uma2 family endonuclease [Chloroflexota bacterium]|nr:Uma2 family endonuclease [Chloroflexota bacterium]